MFVMKLRETAAAVLVGWYLMVPPSKQSATYSYKLPLSRWVIVQRFDGIEDCQDFEATFFDSSRQAQALGVLDPAYRDYMFAECIATDDPRLKGN
jgi:hypothetical protein